MGCIACWSDGGAYVLPEIHHLNLGGRAGQKRRGDEFTIPLCAWHHQGHKPERFGPSLKWNSKAFRAKYGRDDDLLAKVNDLMRMMDDIATGHHRSEAEVSRDV
jgi:hypothetical protein